MIIAIDGYEANVASRVGIGQYAFEIVRNLYLLLKERNPQQHTIHIYLPSSPQDDLPPEASWWRYRVLGPKRLWTIVGLPLGLKKDMPHADVVFSPTHYIPRFVRVPKVMAVMDLSYLVYPEMFRGKDLHQLTAWTKYSVDHAQKIVTISEFSKNAIIHAYHVPESKVIVTYPGFTMKSSLKASNGPKVQEKYSIAGDYILSVGTLQPRKNYVALIEAFSKIKAKSIELVIVGKKGWLYEDIMHAPSHFGAEGRVRFLDFVPDEDLSALYASALCFALPSLYEGFGLPVLEAMAYGCPVVVSDVSSLPEIAGGAGIYVDPKSTESIMQGLEKGIDARKTAEGKKKIAMGLDQIKKFTWEKAAKQTLAVLESVGRKS